MRYSVDENPTDFPYPKSLPDRHHPLHPLHHHHPHLSQRKHMMVGPDDYAHRQLNHHLKMLSHVPLPVIDPITFPIDQHMDDGDNLVPLCSSSTLSIGDSFHLETPSIGDSFPLEAPSIGDSFHPETPSLGNDMTLGGCLAIKLGSSSAHTLVDAGPSAPYPPALMGGHPTSVQKTYWDAIAHSPSHFGPSNQLGLSESTLVWSVSVPTANRSPRPPRARSTRPWRPCIVFL